MGWVRLSKANRLALGVLLLAAYAAGAAEPKPVPYRAISRHQVPDLIVGAVKDWAVGLDEVKAFEAYIRDRENWTPRFLGTAGMAGAAFGYFEGGAGSFSVGAWNVSLDASGKELRRTISRQSGRLLGLGLGRPDQGWSAEAVLGLRDGRFLSQSVAVAFKLRY